jgi:hypothetical protein
VAAEALRLFADSLNCVHAEDDGRRSEFECLKHLSQSPFWPFLDSQGDPFASQRTGFLSP